MKLINGATAPDGWNTYCFDRRYRPQGDDAIASMASAKRTARRLQRRFLNAQMRDLRAFDYDPCHTVAPEVAEHKVAEPFVLSAVPAKVRGLFSVPAGYDVDEPAARCVLVFTMRRQPMERAAPRVLHVASCS